MHNRRQIDGAWANGELNFTVLLQAIVAAVYFRLSLIMATQVC